jgi:hypothetical protein
MLKKDGHDHGGWEKLVSYALKPPRQLRELRIRWLTSATIVVPCWESYNRSVLSSFERFGRHTYNSASRTSTNMVIDLIHSASKYQIEEQCARSISFHALPLAGMAAIKLRGVVELPGVCAPREAERDIVMFAH